MRILGIDTTGQTASAALVEDDKLICEFTLNYKLTHSQTIMPMIAEIIERSETDKASIDCIACAAGPGSFTGLRIGAATAKGFALALDKPVIVGAKNATKLLTQGTTVRLEATKGIVLSISNK